ncbi:MAG: thiamine-monophosphate kinase [Proteobacteria bacterium]|nr:MAG: thiamine-monophosphate kinase [Pseudomonadota bacterium]
MNEQSLIDLIKQACPSNASVLIGIDDDAAVLKPTVRETLVCTDMLMDGVHFRVKEALPSAIGHKALGVNLSDIAAMGGKALSAYVSLAIPKDLTTDTFIQSFYQGLTDLARSFDVAIAGGDTNIWKGPLVVNVTVLGESHAKGPILRSGAKPGDKVFVTGPLGGSLSGHHLTFTPRLREVRELLDHYAIHSMMDISDGLAKDLREITRQSGVKVILDKSAIPIQPHIKSHKDALQKAMSDGEDFELCFTLSAEEAERLKNDSRFSYCKEIGVVAEGEDLYFSGEKTPISWQGYQHGVKR